MAGEQEGRAASARAIFPGQVHLLKAPEGAAGEEGPTFLDLRHLIHDLRQPLAAIRSIVGEVRLRAVDPVLEDRLALVDDQVTIMDRLLRSMSQVPERGLVELSTVTEQALAASRAAYPGCVLHASIQRAATDSMDELTWWRIVHNLVDNGLRSAGPGGEVGVTLRTIGDHIELRVDDDGRAPFGVVPSGETLGLRFVIGAVHVRKGRLSLEARPSGGCAVSVTIPCTRPFDHSQ